MIGEPVMVLDPRPSKSFVETAAVRDVVARAIAYLECGLPVNLSGASGTGKTTMALHVARKLGRPVVFLSGDEGLSSTDMAGGLFGYRRRRVVDNFIHSVLKTEDDLVQRWVDSRVAAACKYGFTLVYDEYTRSRPEANNPLLSVLEEGILVMPGERGEEGYIRVHPCFRAIFTSNPAEYAGSHRQPDALTDRMVTIHLGYYDEETEVAIARAHSGLDETAASWAVNLVRLAREKGFGRLSTRACVAIARVMAQHELRPDPDDQFLFSVCRDVVSSARDCAEDSFRELWAESFRECAMAGEVAAGG